MAANGKVRDEGDRVSKRANRVRDVGRDDRRHTLGDDALDAINGQCEFPLDDVPIASAISFDLAMRPIG